MMEGSGSRSRGVPERSSPGRLLMNEARTEKLKKAGWKLGTPKEFLGLTDEQAALIEIKLALAKGIKERRLSPTAHTGSPREAIEIE